jgi:hypothetical protein
VVEPVEHLPGAQLRLLRVEPGLLEQRGNAPRSASLAKCKMSALFFPRS